MRYVIQPTNSYQVIRNCPKCGHKTQYINTNCFRINANGNQIDIWLIYQCQHCKHTYNLTIYQRVTPSSIPKEEYERFLRNDSSLALAYGLKKELFVRNKAIIDVTNMDYSMIQNAEDSLEHEICIYNPWELKLRVDILLSKILQLSRSQIKELSSTGALSYNQTYVGRKLEVTIGAAVSTLLERSS